MTSMTLRKPQYPALARAARLWAMPEPTPRHERLMSTVRRMNGGRPLQELRAEQNARRVALDTALDGRDWLKWRRRAAVMKGFRHVSVLPNR